MIEDLLRSIKFTLSEKVASPLFGAFIGAWFVWNYRFMIVVLSDLSPADKFSYIDSHLYPGNYDHLLIGFMYPLLTAGGFIFLYPFPAALVYKFWRSRNKKLSEIKQQIDDETPLTNAEARRIRRDAAELELRFDEDMRKRNEEVERLKRLVVAYERERVDREGHVMAGTNDRPEPVEADSNYLEPDALKVLSIVSKNNGKLTANNVATMSKQNITRVELYLEELSAKGLLRGIVRDNKQAFELTTSGKRRALEEGFI